MNVTKQVYFALKRGPSTCHEISEIVGCRSSHVAEIMRRLSQSNIVTKVGCIKAGRRWAYVWKVTGTLPAYTRSMLHIENIQEAVLDEIKRSPSSVPEIAKNLRISQQQVKSACGALRGKRQIRLVKIRRPSPGKPALSRYEAMSQVKRSWLQHVCATDDGFEAFGKHFTDRLPAHRHAYTVTHEVTPCHS